jgi:tetratricopeptide (TPR) repeat protein
MNINDDVSKLISQLNESPNGDIVNSLIQHAINGNLNANMALACWYEKTGDKTEEFKYTLNAANMNEAQSMTFVAHCYERGEGVPVNHKLAFDWARRAYLCKNTGGMLVLSRLYENGIGVQKDVYQARRIMEEACAGKNDANSLFELGRFYLENGEYLHGINLLEEFIAKRDEFKDVRSKKIIGDIALRLGLQYTSGEHIQKNDKVGMEYIEIASKCDNAQAQINMASSLMSIDSKRAVYWLEKAIRSGMPMAYLAKGYWILLGLFGDVDKIKAKAYLEKAIEKSTSSELVSIARELLDNTEMESSRERNDAKTSRLASRSAIPLTLVVGLCIIFCVCVFVPIATCPACEGHGFYVDPILRNIKWLPISALNKELPCEYCDEKKHVTLLKKWMFTEEYLK